MSRVNLGMVRDRAREIRKSTQKVRTYTALPDDEFFVDERNLLAVMHLLLIAIEAAASLCTHLAAKTAERAPDSYADCFDWLRADGRVDDALAARHQRDHRPAIVSESEWLLGFGRRGCTPG